MAIDLGPERGLQRWRAGVEAESHRGRRVGCRAMGIEKLRVEAARLVRLSQGRCLSTGFHDCKFKRFRASSIGGDHGCIRVAS